MNSSKFRGPAACGAACLPLAPFRETKGTVLSATPSAQQSLTPSPLASPFTAHEATFPLACGFPFDDGFGTGFAPALSAPNRASMAPTTHSLMTSGGRPYSDPWNGYRVYTSLL